MPSKMDILKEVLWCHPPQDSIKANIDSASGGTALRASYEGILRNHRGEHLGSFTCNHGQENAFFC